MSVSPWNYFRGAAAVMAGDLASQPNSGLTVQLCGDAHVLNFGLWATPERNLMFDVRDFDETLPGPFEWDVKRLATSLVVVAREHGVKQSKPPRPRSTAAVEAYRHRMRRYATMPELDIWYDGMHVDNLISYYAPADRGRVSDPHRQETQAAAPTVAHSPSSPRWCTDAHGSPRSHRSGSPSTTTNRSTSSTTCSPATG